MSKSNTFKAIGAAAFVTLAATVGAPVTLQNEGMKLVPYYDSVGVKTWCVGETEVGYKKEFTKSECDFLYTIRYGYYSMRVAEFYSDIGKATVTPEMHAAFTDLAYNVGINAVKTSSAIRAVNSGDATAACDATLKYKFVGKTDCSKPNKVCRGVWDRRVKMHALCTKGVTNAVATPDRA